MHLYAAASSPWAQAALNLASEGEKTKGPKAVFAVVLMFGILCGGVFMLLQSSFGPKVGYLITGTAFWGSWLVLSILWLVGVPGLPMPAGIPDVPRSTVQFTGPQGTDQSWNFIDTEAEKTEHAVPEDQLITVDPANITDQSTTGEVAAATTAANEAIAKHYAEKAGVEQSSILPGSVYVVDRTEIARKARRVQWVRIHTKAATPNAAASEETKELIRKVEPARFDLYFEPGNLSTPTYIAIAVFVVLFLVHVVLLGLTDTARAPRPQGVPERMVHA